MEPRPQFELRAVTVAFQGDVALSNIDLRIDAGERVAIVGPSGAGKTTLLRLLNGSTAPTAGSVHVDGAELGSLSARELRGQRRTIAFVPQDLGLVPNLRVSANVLMGSIGSRGLLGSLRALIRPKRDELIKAHELLERVGIADKLFQRVDRLSGGERQRVAVARALYQEPRALLADEPVSSVDPGRSRDTVDLLTSLAAEQRWTLVASLHDRELAAEFCDRLIGIRDGQVAFDRRAEDVGHEAFEALYALPASAP